MGSWQRAPPGGFGEFADHASGSVAAARPHDARHRAPPLRADPPPAHHLAARARRRPVLVDDQPFADPTSLLLQPDHYVTRLLHANGVALGRTRRRARAAARGGRPDRVAAAVRELARSSAARPCATGSRASWPRSSASPNGRARPTRTSSTTQIADRWPNPSSGPRALLRRFGIDVLATTDDPVDDLAAHDALSGRRRLRDPSGAHVPPGPLPRSRVARLGRGWSSCSASPPGSTSATTPATSTRWPPAGATSSNTAPSRPTTATSTPAPNRSSGPRRPASIARRSPARSAPPRRPHSAGT